MTIKKIAHVEVGSGGTAELIIADIPQSYDSLVLVYSLRSSFRADMGLKINGSTSNFNNRYVASTGTSVFNSTGYGNLIAVVPGSANTANLFSNGQLTLHDYTAAQGKNYLARNGQGTDVSTGYDSFIGGYWNNNDAVTSLSIYQLNGDNITEFSSATLYALKGGSDGTTVIL
jgi:hypothetical protein